MVEHGDSPAPPPAAVVRDGRFGERFDDEVRIPGIVWIAVGLALTCAVAFAVTWGLWQVVGGKLEQAQAGASPLVVPGQRQLPPGPLLQADPEAEYEALRREMEAKLHGYGWLDEAAGTVYIPIDEAIDLVLAEGLPVRGADQGVAAAAEPARAQPPAGEAATEPAQDEEVSQP